MPNYELAEAANDDLQNIAQYTLSKWGAKQVADYGALLDAHFEAIGNGKARTRIFLPPRPEVRRSRTRERQDFEAEALGNFHHPRSVLLLLRGQSGNCLEESLESRWRDHAHQATGCLAEVA